MIYNYFSYVLYKCIKHIHIYTQTHYWFCLHRSEIQEHDQHVRLEICHLAHLCSSIVPSLFMHLVL